MKKRLSKYLLFILHGRTNQSFRLHILMAIHKTNNNIKKTHTHIKCFILIEFNLPK